MKFPHNTGLHDLALLQHSLSALGRPRMPCNRLVQARPNAHQNNESGLF